MGRYTRTPQTPADQQALRAALDAFDSAEAAKPIDREPIPAADYTADINPGGSFFGVNRNSTPFFKIEFRIAEGPHTGRRVWFDIFLSAAALPYAKAELSKIGVTRRSQLEQPLPEGIRCKIRVGLERNDNGTTFNCVRGICELVAFEPPAPDVFAPATPSQPHPAEPTGPQPTEPAGDSQTELPF